MICHFSSMQTYQLGAVFEFCHWVVGLKMCGTITLISVTLESRE